MLRNRVLERIFYSLPYEMRRDIASVLQRKRFYALQERRAIDTREGYSYKPFDQHRCIFVHIPKAAGVSVAKTLFGNLGGGHSDIKTYQIVFSRKEFDQYFKFTFVRNPWDRLFSAYNFLRQGGINENDRRWAAENLSSYGSFEDFVTRRLNRSNTRQYYHFIPQHEFLCLPGRQLILVDFLGFFENLEEDFVYIRDKLSLQSRGDLRRENITARNNLDYRNFYTDTMRDIVADAYATDIELFGYNFDNSSLASQLANRPT